MSEIFVFVKLADGYRLEDFENELKTFSKTSNELNFQFESKWYESSDPSPGTKDLSRAIRILIQDKCIDAEWINIFETSTNKLEEIFFMIETSRSRSIFEQYRNVISINFERMKSVKGIDIEYSDDD